MALEQDDSAECMKSTAAKLSGEATSLVESRGMPSQATRNACTFPNLHFSDGGVGDKVGEWRSLRGLGHYKVGIVPESEC